LQLSHAGRLPAAPAARHPPASAPDLLAARAAGAGPLAGLCGLACARALQAGGFPAASGPDGLDAWELWLAGCPGVAQPGGGGPADGTDGSGAGVLAGPAALEYFRGGCRGLMTMHPERDLPRAPPPQQVGVGLMGFGGADERAAVRGESRHTLVTLAPLPAPRPRQQCARTGPSPPPPPGASPRGRRGGARAAGGLAASPRALGGRAGRASFAAAGPVPAAGP
jgi:hypothetical protein